MKALVCNSYGNPSQVLGIENKSEPKPGSGEVLVRMILSPVNPSDLLFIQGKYGNQPNPPQTPGFEGVGIVEAGNGCRSSVRVMAGGKRKSLFQQGKLFPCLRILLISRRHLFLLTLQLHM
jgi:NADPH:quinone reductase-like Zn-dependent oxidoreductase